MEMWCSFTDDAIVNADRSSLQSPHALAQVCRLMRLPPSWYCNSPPHGHTLGYFLEMKSKAFASRRLPDGSTDSTRHHFDGLGFRVDSASCIRDVGYWIMQKNAECLAQIAKKLAQEAEREVQRAAQRAALKEENLARLAELAVIDASIARLSDLPVTERSPQDDVEHTHQILGLQYQRALISMSLAIEWPWIPFSPQVVSVDVESLFVSLRVLDRMPFFHVYDGPSDGLLKLLTFDKIGLDAWDSFTLRGPAT
jgi:hypothetical protein